MLFHRDFAGYTGGHGKVWDYFNHALALGWDARIFLTPGSLRDATNPWMAVPERIVSDWTPDEADALFLAGMDWRAVLRGPERGHTTLNLIQHVRHAVDDPALPLRTFLKHPAWRICVSSAVAEAILGTGEVNGPVRVIPAAVSLPGLPRVAQRRGEVFIAALKQPELGRALRAELEGRGYSVALSSEWITRDTFLARMASAQIVVVLPHATEGFFLPGLEAMALGRPVVMPRCIGNLEYARDGVNCLMPAMDTQALTGAVDRISDPEQARHLVEAGLATAGKHSRADERRAFAAMLAEMGLA